MKITYSRVRQLEITISFYSPARDLRPAYCAREDPRGRTRRVGSGHLIFGRSAILSF